MSRSVVTLRSFSENELIFDTDETKEILRFFFPHRRPQIEIAAITPELRNFAQGLLIEAIDATYALGYIEIVVKALNNPGAGMAKILSKIGRKAAKHWFKHATQKDLLKAKISSRVRDKLAQNFASVLPMMLEGIARVKEVRRTNVAYVEYGSPSKTDSFWG